MDEAAVPVWTPLQDYCAAVADFIETVEIPRPVPCGLSIGGAIVLQLILEHKERFKAAILVNTGARLRVMPLILETIKKDYEKFLSTIPVFAASEKTDPRKLASLMADTAKCNPETAYGDFKACDRFDVTDKLSAIITPVLILTAEDDKLTPPKVWSIYERTHQECINGKYQRCRASVTAGTTGSIQQGRH